MINLKTHAALAAALAGAIALSAVTPSFARDRTWAAAGAGFAAGALVGAAAANANTNANVYYGPGYAYGPGYPYGYAYAPGYVGPAQAYAYAPGFPLVMGLNGDVGNDVYVNGQYVGSDPDPRIRASIRAEAKSNN